MVLPVLGGAVMQPWNQIVWPDDMPAPMSPTRAKALPAVGRVIGLLSGMIKQMPLENYDGKSYLAKPRLLEQPDPSRPRAWWVGVMVEDYLLNGNAIGVVTVRDSFGYPLAVVWIPAEWVAITWTEDRRGVDYWVGGEQLPTQDVIHVQRGADRWCPYRGVGLVEQHFQQLSKIDDQDRYERSILQGSGVPSVAVIAPNAELQQEVADEAKTSWVEKFSGPVRQPAILPAGTSVIPLAWSPADSELSAARGLNALDVANMANMDGWWVGAPSGSFSYKSPGPMYLNLIRQTINPILEDFEGVWSAAWLPRGRWVRADRTVVLKDDMQTMIATATAAVNGGLWTVAEGRAYLGYSEDLPADLLPPAPRDPTPPAGDDQDNQNDQEGTNNGDDTAAA